MAMSAELDEISLISKGLYRVVSDVVRPECITKLIRQFCNLQSAFVHCDTFADYRRIMSGSRAEGFAFKSSDLDLMIVDRRVIVLSRPTLPSPRGLHIPTILLMEADNVSPGFTFIRCLTCDPNNQTIFHTLVWKGSDAYVSSRLIRENALSTETSTTHGPCQTGNLYGSETDLAYTLHSPFWPKQAASFVDRSLNQGWPSYDVLTDICNDGCLLVAINSKNQFYSDTVDFEWRISFSLAEKKLIYSMNRCQFLCYGLLKLILNEIFKTIPSLDDLLCSYFMKTAVFWEISERPEDWSIENFLSKFWNVFRRLIKWVNEGYCPNFFIPENNMFYGKIFGENKRRLLSVLGELFSDGYLCLLRCSSLGEKLSIIIRQPFVAYILPCNEEEYVPMYGIEKEWLRAIACLKPPFPTDDVKRIITILHNTVNLNTETEETMCAVRLQINQILQLYAEYLSLSVKSLYPSCTYNRTQYQTIKSATKLLHKTKSFLYMNYFIYAKCTYMKGNYNKTIELLHFIKGKFQSQLYMYELCLDDDIIMARRQQGMSYDTLIKSFIVSEVHIANPTSIEELQLECHASTTVLYIPPTVFMSFLLLLSYARLGYNHSQHDILEELHTLLCHDNNYHIRMSLKAISWEILGICQQLCGDRHGAFQSYINALEDKFNSFTQATKARINSLYE